MLDNIDVAIVGAGLAGGALALLLARAGARVAMVDPARFPRDKLCGEFLSPECWDVLARLGLADEVETSGYHAIRSVRLSTPRGRVLDAEFAPVGSPPGIGLSRSFLDAALAKQAQSAGALLFEETRANAPLIENNRVVGIRARRGNDEPFALRARVTVAASGRHSALVAATGTTRGRSGRRPNLFGLKHHLNVPDAVNEPVGSVGLHLVPGGYGGTCRVEPPLTNFCGLLPESVLKRHRGNLDLLARDHFARNPLLDRLWRAATPSGAWKTVSGVRVESSRPTIEGILYAGDCQGTVDPLGGQGMTMALLGAEVLAPFVLRALAATGPGADASLQRACDAAWHRRFDRRINLCRFFHHILINPGMVDLASTIPPLARRLLALGYSQTRDPA